MSPTDAAPAAGTRPDSEPHSLQRSAKRFGDTVFRSLSTGSGILILLILAAVASFLVGLALPALLADPAELQFGRGVSFWEYVAPYAFGTMWSSILAMLVAVPVAVGIALYLTHYAPKRVASTFGYVIDLLAAVPSVVFGLWGIAVLAPALRPLFLWLEENLGFIPLFSGPVSGTGRTILTASLVLAVMILPIITAISREVFLQTPRLHEEASLALGATRWEMIRQAVIPFGMPGIISACMLGLGRALGETMAVAMVLSGSEVISIQLLTSQNPNTIAANIAQSFPEAHDIGRNQLIATGLVLFVITLAVNMTARWIINRRKEFSGAN
ncbi:phosphate ABC transporter permease subunit PstC [Tessaracoccus flavus]|uniref:Phosphate transport system permease protein n=1 Tax=Tessaracoccus flavus TaxID=1610493 RepID=A0A1Q2CC53_9ACTN|nr:phosphate ABC transporter permease subunit PstC [Tessaracoccus flavus]AQP43693.1 phosphate ABC transporter permease subunit PstC [Tessaracoccus flavus]SDZ02857.1 phosphate ABC transporter membrane protein 1, PhoT family [Tessaracoccus flavus]